MNRGAFSGTRRATRPFVEGGLTNVQSEALPEDESTQAVRFFLDGYKPPSSRHKLRTTNIQKRYIFDNRDAISWVTGESTTSISGLFYANGLYLLGSSIVNGILKTSTDGITWTTQVSNFASNMSIDCFAYGNNIWLAGGGYNAPGQAQINSSTDGITWVTRFYSTTSSFPISRIVFANNLWVSGSVSGQIKTSTDTITWVTQVSNINDVKALAYGNNTWLVGGNTNQLRISTDAITWTTVVAPNFPGSIEGLVYANGKWVGVGSNNGFGTSTDGITWVTRTGIGANTDIAYGNGVYVVSGSAGSLNTSTDGITWTSRVSNFGASTIRKVTFGNNIFVIGGNSGSRNSAISTFRYPYSSLETTSIKEYIVP